MNYYERLLNYYLAYWILHDDLLQERLELISVDLTNTPAWSINEIRYNEQ